MLYIGQTILTVTTVSSIWASFYFACYKAIFNPSNSTTSTIYFPVFDFYKDFINIYIFAYYNLWDILLVLNIYNREKLIYERETDKKINILEWKFFIMY